MTTIRALSLMSSMRHCTSESTVSIFTPQESGISVIVYLRWLVTPVLLSSAGWVQVERKLLAAHNLIRAHHGHQPMLWDTSLVKIAAERVSLSKTSFSVLLLKELNVGGSWVAVICWLKHHASKVILHT